MPPMSATQQTMTVVVSAVEQAVTVHCEPEGMEYEVPLGTHLRFEFTGPPPQQVEVSPTASVVVLGRRPESAVRITAEAGREYP